MRRVLYPMLFSAAVLHGAVLFKDPQFKVKVTSDIVYGTAPVRAPQPGNMDLKLDLYEPQGDGAPTLRPAVILIHGGGFHRGDKNYPNLKRFCNDLASRGYACASIAYRLIGSDPSTASETREARLARAIRMAVEDATTAARWMVSHAPEHHIDPQRLAMGGFSAGAITSLYVGYGALNGPKIPIRALLSMWGTMYDRVSSISAGGPSVLLIHGTNDHTVPISGAEAVVKRAKEVGVYSEFYPIEGAAHGVSLDQVAGGDTLFGKIVAFLYSRLGLFSLRR